MKGKRMAMKHITETGGGYTVAVGPRNGNRVALCMSLAGDPVEVDMNLRNAKFLVESLQRVIAHLEDGTLQA